MEVSFTLEQLLQVFEDYNLAFWPMHLLAYLIGIAAVILTFKPVKQSNRIISGILAFLWLWTGVVFYLFYFGPIYPPAYWFGGLFILQSILFLAAVVQSRLSFASQGGKNTIIALVFIAYAMVGYPLFGYFIGHLYPQSPPFGITPCPLTAFTFGLLLLTDRKIPKLFLAIPLLWSLGGFVPVSVGILEDIGMIIAGLLGPALIFIRDRTMSD